MTNGKSKHDVDYLTWLNKERSRCQNRNIGLLAVLRSERNPIRAPSTTSQADWFDFAQLMLGANFSYWRAIFLAETCQSQVQNLEHMKVFLEPLAFDNSLTFQRDVESEAWTLGYYMNNCLFRIRTSATILEKIELSLLTKLVLESSAYKAIVEGSDYQTPFDTNREHTATPIHNREKLDQMSDALDRLFAELPGWTQPLSKSVD